MNPATSNETLCMLAARPFASVVDAIAHNQIRLVQCDELLEVLGENPLTGSATIERILEFLARERGEIPTSSLPSRTRPRDSRPSCSPSRRRAKVRRSPRKKTAPRASSRSSST